MSPRVIGADGTDARPCAGRSLGLGDRGNMPAMVADPLDASAGVPYERLAELRDACPVSRTASGAYFLARHDDVLAATKDIEVFQASFRAPGVVVPPEEQLISEIPEPRHGKIRRIINSAIAQHRISRVEPFVRSVCNDLLDGIVARGGGDLVAEYVTPIPATVIAHLLGVDPADHARFAEWSDLVVQSTYATKNRREDGDDGEGLAGVAPDFTAYLDAMIAERKASADPPDDFVTRLINTEVDGERLTDLEMRTQLAFLLMSGNETTRHLIGNMLETVCTDPALLRATAGRARPRADRGRGVAAPRPADPRADARLPRATSRSTASRSRPASRSASASPRRTATSGPTTIPTSSGSTARARRTTSRSAAARTSARARRSRGSKAASRSRCSSTVSTEPRVDDGYRREPVPVFWANGPRRLPVTLAPA